MLVDYPDKWHEYFLQNAPQLRTFRKDTPQEIVEKAKLINASTLKHAGKQFFHFEKDIVKA